MSKLQFSCGNHEYTVLENLGSHIKTINDKGEIEIYTAKEMERMIRNSSPTWMETICGGLFEVYGNRMKTK